MAESRKRHAAAVVVAVAFVFPAVAATADDATTTTVPATSIETPTTVTVAPPPEMEPWFTVRANWTATRDIRFPVLGPVVFRNDWGECRDGETASVGLSAAETTACPATTPATTCSA